MPERENDYTSQSTNCYEHGVGSDRSAPTRGVSEVAVTTSRAPAETPASVTARDLGASGFPVAWRWLGTVTGLQHRVEHHGEQHGDGLVGEVR